MIEQTFEHKGFTFKLETRHDPQAGPPWEECDGHGPVREAEVDDDGEAATLRDGELSLCWHEHGPYVYDVEGALEQALEEDWGPRVEGETPFQRAVRTVRADFEYLRGWATDEWSYCTVFVTLLDKQGHDTSLRDSFGGIEDNDGAYIHDAARGLADDLLEDVPSWIQEQVESALDMKKTWDKQHAREDDDAGRSDDLGDSDQATE
jgi:hypothetical protein